MASGVCLRFSVRTLRKDGDIFLTDTLIEDRLHDVRILLCAKMPNGVLIKDIAALHVGQHL